MDLLIDSNVFLDLILDRDTTGNIKRLFPRIEKNRDRAFFTSSSATDMFYIIRKTLRDLDATYKSMWDILKLARILQVNEEDILLALHAKWKDFEDCVQFMVAMRNRMDCIVTRNKRDFEDNSVPIISPEEYFLRVR